MIKDLKFEFCYRTAKHDSFRCKSLVGQYDLENKETIQAFKGDHSLPDNWNIGLIVGGSGTRKTSIAKKVFGDFVKAKWDKRPIIDNFDDSLDLGDITNALGNVGFNSVPYWLKSFDILSNGEKSRVELARLAMENNLVVCDEFTSFVDRDVAKSMSNSVSKLFKKMNKKFVAVTCHKDITSWLKPDWVYDTDENVFFCPKTQKERSSTSKLEKSKEKFGSSIKDIII